MKKIISASVLRNWCSTKWDSRKVRKILLHMHKKTEQDEYDKKRQTNRSHETAPNA